MFFNVFSLYQAINYLPCSRAAELVQFLTSLWQSETSVSCIAPTHRSWPLPQCARDGTLHSYETAGWSYWHLQRQYRKTIQTLKYQSTFCVIINYYINQIFISQIIIDVQLIILKYACSSYLKDNLARNQYCRKYITLK